MGSHAREQMAAFAAAVGGVDLHGGLDMGGGADRLRLSQLIRSLII